MTANSPRDVLDSWTVCFVDDCNKCTDGAIYHPIYIEMNEMKPPIVTELAMEQFIRSKGYAEAPPLKSLCEKCHGTGKVDRELFGRAFITTRPENYYPQES